MTDPDSILQLGIEAAREGNKEEARNLFRLLTSEDSTNVQVWLWLAGVSESAEERQAALERVLELDPQNEMAKKSLAALQSSSSHTTPSESPASMPISSPEQGASPSTMPDDSIDDFDDPFAELDSLSDVFAEDSKAVGRSDIPNPVNTPLADAVGDTSSNTSSKSYQDSRSTVSKSSSSFGRSGDKGSKSSMEKQPSRNLFRLVALVLAVLIVVLGVVFVVVPRFFGPPEVAVIPVGTENNQPANDTQGQPPADGQDTGDAAGGNAEQPIDPPTATPETPQVAPTVPEPADPVPPSVPVDNSVGNITILPSNSPLESNGWLYDFNQQVCANSCARQWFGNIGNIQPQGRFVIVLMMVVNRTGQDQPVPADFVVLKDAQGRVYNALPQASAAYVIPGINADLSHESPIPANGLATSIAVVFDVQPDATDLVMYSPTNAGQGWLVLNSVQ